MFRLYLRQYTCHDSYTILPPCLISQISFFIPTTKPIMPRTALFVIDIQVSLASNSSTEIPAAARIREAGTSILQRARQAIDTACEQGREPDLEIVFVQHEEIAEKGDLVRGSEAWELVFKPREGDVWERLVGKDVREYIELFRFHL